MSLRLAEEIDLVERSGPRSAQPFWNAFRLPHTPACNLGMLRKPALRVLLRSDDELAVWSGL